MKEKLRSLLFDKPKNIYILIANVVINISWVFLLGLFINKSIKNTLIIIIVWSICLKMGKAKHYSSPLKCFLMQVLLFTSIFISKKAPGLRWLRIRKQKSCRITFRQERRP